MKPLVKDMVAYGPIGNEPLPTEMEKGLRRMARGRTKMIRDRWLSSWGKVQLHDMLEAAYMQAMIDLGSVVAKIDQQS
jgi:hypothetical protein